MTVFSDALAAILHDSGIQIAATFGSATIYGSFENKFIEVEGIETRMPTFEALDTDLATAAHGDTITINATAYTIAGIQPNGEGSTVLILRRSI